MNRSMIARTLIGAAAASLMLYPSAYAQQAAAASSTAASQDELQEVVVTATRQAGTVHDVPLTITAVTAADIQDQGLKRVEDLQRVVPALNISNSNSGSATGGSGIAGSSGTVSISVRGINNTVSGAAATTGIYVDDVPLQLRTAGAGAGGTQLPLLFDLARVEVLKGPQGTLYGGSSEGGTLRFITEQPNFDRNALFAQVEGNTTSGGGLGYEYGITAGAPVTIGGMADRIAVHVAGLFRHDGGYVDHVSQYTGATLASDTNTANHEAVHAIVDFKITDHFLASAGFLWQYEDYSDTDNYWQNIPAYHATSGPGVAGVGAGGTLYNYGPYNVFGPFRNGTNTDIGPQFYTSDAQLKPFYQPHSQGMNIPSLTLDYTTPWFDVKSVTAYVRTRDHSITDASYTDTQGQAGGSLGPNNQLPVASPFIYNLPYYQSVLQDYSDIGTTSQELRFSSVAADSALTWVAGVFVDRTNSQLVTDLDANFNDLKAATGAAGTSQTTAPTRALYEPATLKETQKAIYGEINYLFFSHLKATAGVRYTKDDLDYAQLIGGSLFGFPPGVIVPSEIGSLNSSATTPKFGLQYIVDPNTNFYVSAAQGYRPGGLNPALSPGCVAKANTLGYPAGSIAATFQNDSLWSYEGGAKLRFWDNRASVNVSAFYIDWKNVQTTIGNVLDCGQAPSINAASEVSKGFEFDGSALLFPGFTATLRFGYTNAYYSAAVAAPTGTPVIINDGDRVLGLPKETGILSGEYRFAIASYMAFARADWSYRSDLATSYGFGSATYTPDYLTLPSSSVGNIRIGVDIAKFEASLFVNNVTNSQDLLFQGSFGVAPGRNNCTNAACTTYRTIGVGGVAATFTPRQIGLDLGYRY